MKKIILSLVIILLNLGLTACTNKDIQEEKKYLGDEILNAFEKNKDLNNYHMLSQIDNKTYDVNIENLDGLQNMAGTVIYVTEILSHKDYSVVGTREVREFLYKKGESTEVFRELDGLYQYDMSLDNLNYYDNANEKVSNMLKDLKADKNGIENIVVNEKEDGSKEYVFEGCQYVVDIDGYLISYKDLNNSYFTLDSFNEVTLDYTYCTF